jgi:hypothetical protein
MIGFGRDAIPRINMFIRIELSESVRYITPRREGCHIGARRYGYIAQLRCPLEARHKTAVINRAIMERKTFEEYAV